MSRLPLNSLAYALWQAARIDAAVFAGQSLADGLLGRVDPAARPAVQDLVYGSLRAYGRGDFFLSRLLDKPLAEKTIAFGEVGLSGEIRPVPNGEERLNEAATHGFRRAIVPKANAPKSGSYKGLEVIAVERLADALEHA